MFYALMQFLVLLQHKCYRRASLVPLFTSLPMRKYACLLTSRLLSLAVAMVWLVGGLGCSTDSATEPIAPDAASNPATPEATSMGIPGEADDEAIEALPTAASNTVVPLGLADLEAKIAEFKGKVVVLDIWSTSCLPCMQEFPNLVALAKEYPEQVVCVSLNVDYIGLPKRPPDTYVAEVQAFVNEQAADQVLNYLASDPDSDVLSKYEVEAMPAIVVFDRNGNIAATLTDANASGEGVTYAADVLPWVSRLLTSDENPLP